MEVSVGKKKRNLFLRILFAFLWFVPLFFITNMLIGAVVGAIAGAQVPVGDGSLTNSFSAGYDAGYNASADFFQKYGGIVFICQVILWLGLSIAGILPGTGKYLRAQVAKSDSTALHSEQSQS